MASSYIAPLARLSLKLLGRQFPSRAGCRSLSLSSRNAHPLKVHAPWRSFDRPTCRSFSRRNSGTSAAPSVSEAVKDAASNATKARKSSFPAVSDKIVGYWLLGSAASVFGIVVFGGLTRLTESGFVQGRLLTSESLLIGTIA